MISFAQQAEAESGGLHMCAFASIYIHIYVYVYECWYQPLSSSISQIINQRDVMRLTGYTCAVIFPCKTTICVYMCVWKKFKSSLSTAAFLLQFKQNALKILIVFYFSFS